MISTVRLWNTLMQSAKAGTSGYQKEEDFNNDLAAVQTGLMSMLAPLYSSNFTVKDLLGPFVVPSTGSTTATGVYAKPDDYFQMGDASVSGYPAKPIDTNERAMLRFIPSRRPSSSENIYCFYLEDDSINFLPEETLSVKISYIRQPEEASIILTPTSTADSDYVVATSGGELEWPERAFNLILYMMMQRLGLEMKEQILIEMSNLGIQFETSKI